MRKSASSIVNTESFQILPNSNVSIKFRFLHPGDQSEVKSLCQIWFPIDYPDDWFNDIVENEKYFSLAVCDVQTNSIVGLIVADTLSLNDCDLEDQLILNSDFPRTTPVCYVLLLGVSKEYRRLGLASVLLENLLNTLYADGQCKAIYLHVLCSNLQAIKFYQAKLFEYHFKVPDYYFIKDQYIDGLCFVRYINGGYSPFTLLNYVSLVWMYLLEVNPCRLLAAIGYFIKGKFTSTKSEQPPGSYKRISHVI